jgi:hypothetical protein
VQAIASTTRFFLLKLSSFVERQPPDTSRR